MSRPSLSRPGGRAAASAPGLRAWTAAPVAAAAAAAAATRQRRWRLGNVAVAAAAPRAGIRLHTHRGTGGRRGGLLAGWAGWEGGRGAPRRPRRRRRGRSRRTAGCLGRWKGFCGTWAGPVVQGGRGRRGRRRGVPVGVEGVEMGAVLRGSSGGRMVAREMEMA